MGHAPIPTPLDTGLRRYDGGLVKATGEIKAAAAFLDKVEGGFETRPYGTTQRGCGAWKTFTLTSVLSRQGRGGGGPERHAPIPTPLDTGLRRYDGGPVKAT